MGMSASQVRLMGLTTRMHDLEYKSENIANIKLRLADESDKIAQNYTDALGKQRYSFSTINSNGSTSNTIMDSSHLPNGYVLCARNGATLPSSYNAYQLYDMLESGDYYFKKKNTETNQWEEVTLSSQTTICIESAASADLAKAEAEYNAATAKISRKEKELDRQMTKLDTEHEALKTERDSLKEIIQENVDNTFKLFG